MMDRKQREKGRREGERERERERERENVCTIRLSVFSLYFIWDTS
jgi:hypothetical protein